MNSEILKRDLHFKDEGHEGLMVFRLSYRLAMEIFQISKSFPKEEIYSLTDQVRRSSRSVSANIGEGYRRRVYPKSFSLKMTDSDGECTETVIHLRFACDCGCLSSETFNYFENSYKEIGSMLNGMMNNPNKFYPKNMKVNTPATATATATIK